MRVLILLLMSTALGSVICLEEDVQIVIKESDQDRLIVGKTDLNWNGEKFYSFRGIPYAKPPINELRFKDPQALESLPTFTDARFDGHDCPSITAKNASEDCLVLNIYSSDIHAIEPLPVLVVIHPGVFYVGSGLSSILGPEYLLTKPLVLVTFNYRLGSLGFLNLGTKDIPGNAGLKDQVFALRWIQKYIKYFGGNPNDVSLLGYSAGGLSVGLHLVSPMSMGLFHKAIIMSGSVLPQTILPKGDQKSLAIRQSEILNCPPKDGFTNENILECLRNFSGTEIAATLTALFQFAEQNPVYLWLPIIETDFGQEQFLTKDFFESLSLGEFEKMPILSGFSNGELCESAARIIQDETLEMQFYNNFETLAPIIFIYQGQNNSIQITKALKDYYLGNSSFKHTDLVRLCDLFSDSLIRFGAEWTLSRISSKQDVYSYKFIYKGNVGLLKFRNDPLHRAEHLEDLLYILPMEGYEIPKDHPDGKIVELYVNFIYDFVLNGKFSQNPEGKYPKQFAVIGKEISYENGLSFEDVDFWNKLFP